jgi:eukaryotic-like serine/threonine-protein kinase
MIESTMSPERWRVLEPMLDAVLELEPAERAAHIDEVCASDAMLRSELHALVLACEQGEAMLIAPATVALAPLLADPVVQIPERLGQYQLVRVIGRGGMATVYLADDPKHGRQVAVKVLHPRIARLIGRERFLREIEIAAGLSHPHILPLYDSGEVEAAADPATDPLAADGTSILYFVSPFVAGESLRDRLLREGRMPVSEVVRLGGEIALALDYAHRQGVVHLDIKPDNLLLQEGHAVVADFGIARGMSGAGSAAKAAPLLGTPSYMSPEQAGGAPAIDGRSDVYSLGCVLYEMITGERPLAGNDTITPEELELLRAHAPSALADVVVRAMAPAREDRFAGAGALAEALARSMQEPRAERRRRRSRAVTIGAAIGVVALGTLAAVVIMQRGPSEAVPPLAIAAEKSIAVLPFANPSATDDQAYLADGLTEDLIDLLAKSAELRVTARTSSFRFRDAGLPLADVARQLRVAYVLRGALQQSDSTTRVTAELIHAADSTVVWAETFEQPADRVFALRDEIASKAVKALNTTLLATALTANARQRNPLAYTLVLRGRYLLTQVTRENAARATAYFQQAIHEDSSDALAHAWLARAYQVRAGEGWVPVADGYAQSRVAAEKAIAIDPQLADGYEALAYVQSAHDWDWDAAQTSYQRALELEPGNANVLRSAAMLMAKLERYDEAIIGLRQAIERDPSARSYSNLSYVLGAAGRWDEAEAAARTALALSPNSVLRHFNLARALLFQGRTTAALKEVELEQGETWRLMGRAVTYHALHRAGESDRALAEYAARFGDHAALQIADVYAYRGDTDSAFTWLDRAYAQRDPGIADVKNDPWLRPLRGDPRYAALVKQLRLDQ